MKNYQIAVLIIIVLLIVLIVIYWRRIRRFYNLLMSKYTYLTFREFDTRAMPGEANTYTRDGKTYVTDSGKNNMDKTFIRRLDKARELTVTNKNEFTKGIPFIVINGYRSPEYNAKVGGVPNSAHVRGVGTDLDYTTKEEKEEIMKALDQVGFTRYGVRTGSSGSSIHVDSDETKPQFVVWGYDKVDPGYDFDSNNQLVLTA